MKWIKRLLCRHPKADIMLHLDGAAPGWRYRCPDCGKSGR